MLFKAISGIDANGPSKPGDLVLILVVGMSGAVENSMIRKSSSSPAIDKIVLAWARGLKFLPDSCKQYRLRYLDLPVVISQPEE